jgi:hypothetical protein
MLQRGSVVAPSLLSQKDAPMAWVESPPNPPKPGRPNEGWGFGMQESGKGLRNRVPSSRMHDLALVALALSPASRILNPP